MEIVEGAEMASQYPTLLLASPRPERAFTPLPHPQVHTQLGQGAKKPPGPILLPSPWHISSSQARLGCRLQQRHEDAGSSAGISGDPQSLATSK